MSESWYLKLMGFPELVRPGGRTAKLKVRKHLALLIYLLMDERGVYPRDELAGFLWPEVPDGNSRHSLSMAFSVLRGLFGAEVIRGNHAEVEFTRPDVALDLDRLDRGDVLGTATRMPLEVDGFLRGFTIEDAPAFQHWCDRRNAQLLPQLQAAILLLIDEARRCGNMKKMMALSDRLMALDPLSEEGVRARMEALALQGDRVGALRVFEGWKAQLKEELGAVPSELLEGIAGALRRNQPESAIQHSPRQGSVQRDPRLFIGREREFRELFEAWEDTNQLNTRHVLLTGDTGVGKSTLAMKFAAAVSMEGAAVARVQCFELEQRISFGMIGALVEGLLDNPNAAGTAPEALAEVCRVVPRVRERFPHLPSPRTIEGEAARLHFAEGTFALFDSIMDEQPLLLIIDDYPRSDEASLAVLHMLLRRASGKRLMVLLCGRPPDPSEPVQAERIRKGLSYLPLQKVELSPFGEAESEACLVALLKQAAKPAGFPERMAILRTAGGNPLALALLSRDWSQHGDAALAVSLPAMSEDIPKSVLEAMSYDRMIERLLPDFRPRARLALSLAAVLGPRLNSIECYGIVGLNPTQTMAALSEFTEKKLLRNTDGRLEFVNELIRARIYLKTPQVTRIRLHSGVADHLLRSVESGDTVPNLELAWHCIRAARRDEATPFLMKGAREATLHGAPDEAARALGSGISQLQGSAKSHGILLLAETYQEMAQWSDALVRLQSLDQIARGDPVVRESAEILEIESRRHLGEYSTNNLHDVCEDLIFRIERNVTPHSSVKAGLTAAGIAAELRNEDLAVRVRNALETIPFATLDEAQRGRILLAVAMTYYHSREGDCGLERVSQASALLAQVAATDTSHVRTEIGIGVIRSSLGDYGRGVEHLEAAYKCAERLDNSNQMSQAAGNLSVCFSRLGPPETHGRWAETAWRNAQRTPEGSYDRINAAAHRCLSALSMGHLRRTNKAMRLLHQETARAEQPWVRQAAYLLKADIDFLRGDKSGAFNAARSARMVSSSLLSIGFAGKFARWTALLQLQEGTPADAWKILRPMFKRREKLDLLDHAELLASLYTIGREIALPVRDLSRQTRVILAKLPVACSVQLRRLGLFLPN